MIRANRLLTGLWFLLFVVFSGSQAEGGVPQLINYQGTLTNASGAPVPNGQYTVVFSIYNVPTQGAALWTETTSVATTGGSFSILLGSVNPFPASFFADNSVTYLGVKVGNDAEMLPRQQIASVGYALAAGNGVPKGAIIMWSGAVNQIPEGWALCDGTNGTPNLRDRFIVGAGSGYAVGATGGEAAHSLTVSEMPSHTHIQNAHTHIQDAHTHNVRYEANTIMNVDSSSGRNSWQDSDGGTMGAPSNLIGSTTGTNQNTTAINQNTGGGAAHENRPPYYALAFIMKI